MKYRENDIAYIVENNLRVTKVRVIRAAGGRCTVSPGEGKAMRLPEGRLYESAEEAEKHIYRPKTETDPSPAPVRAPRDPHEWEFRNRR